MEAMNETDAHADALSAAHSCTPEEQGLWMLWWRYKDLRGGVDELDEAPEGLLSVPERRIESLVVEEERNWVVRALEANGMLVCLAERSAVIDDAPADFQDRPLPRKLPANVHGRKVSLFGPT